MQLPATLSWSLFAYSRPCPYVDSEWPVQTPCSPTTQPIVKPLFSLPFLFEAGVNNGLSNQGCLNSFRELLGNQGTAPPPAGLALGGGEKRLAFQ